MRKDRRSAAVAACVIFVLICAVAICEFACQPSHEDVLKSAGQLRGIGLAIRDFEEKNAKLPSKLSDLVPQFIPKENVGLFYILSGGKSCGAPANWKSDFGLIDTCSPFLYFGSVEGRGDILAVLRTDCFGASPVLYSDYHIEIKPGNEVLQLMPRKGMAR